MRIGSSVLEDFDDDNRNNIECLDCRGKLHAAFYDYHVLNLNQSALGLQILLTHQSLHDQACSYEYDMKLTVGRIFVPPVTVELHFNVEIPACASAAHSLITAHID